MRHAGYVFSCEFVLGLALEAHSLAGGLQALGEADVAVLEALALGGGEIGGPECGDALVEAVAEHLRLELLGVDLSLGLHF